MYSLPQIKQKIHQYLSDHNDTNSFLNLLINNIECFYKIQRNLRLLRKLNLHTHKDTQKYQNLNEQFHHFLEMMLTAQFKEKDDLYNEIQHNLNQLDDQSQLNVTLQTLSHKLTKMFAYYLLTNIEENLNQADGSYKWFLNALWVSIRGLNSHLETQEKDYQFFSESENDVAKLVKELNGHYFPFNQDLDPFNGRYEGACHGYVNQWYKDILKNRNTFKLPRLNSKVWFWQETQESPFFKSTKAYGRRADLQNLITFIINKLSPEKIFYLGFIFESNDGGHAMGMRLLGRNGNDGIELFDPNFGIVMFQNQGAFKNWLAQHLSTHYAKLMALGGSVEIYPLGKSKNTISSISTLSETPVITEDIGSNESNNKGNCSLQ